MERKKISLNGLQNALSPKEMKDITGGSYHYWIGCCDGPSYSGIADSCEMVKWWAEEVCDGCAVVMGHGC